MSKSKLIQQQMTAFYKEDYLRKKALAFNCQHTWVKMEKLKKGRS